MNDFYVTNVGCYGFKQTSTGPTSEDVVIPSGTLGIDTGDHHPGDGYPNRVYYNLITPYGRVWISKYNLTRV
jgi:hypothetical protein